MRNFHDCIDNAMIEDVISREEAERLHQAHQRNTGAQGEFGFDEQAAAQRTFDEFEAELAIKRRQKILAVQAQMQVQFDMRGYADERGRANLNDGARALFDSTPFAGKTPGLTQIHEAVRGRLHAAMARAFEKFERNLIGETRNKALLSDVVDALFGKTNVPQGAKEIAEAWRITAERARLMFNGAGGRIGFREDWGLPQGHDWEMVNRVSQEDWIAFVTPLLDRNKMISGLTGRPFSDAELTLALTDTYQAITTEGWSRREASGVQGGSSLANRRADPRFLIFKDGAGWRNYMARFGEGDPFKVMMDYLDGMAKDIAMMQRFGPNPTAGIEYARQLVTRDAALKTDPAAKEAARATVADMDAMHQQFTGKAAIPARKIFASVMSETRQWLVAAQLGGAMLSAISDVGFQQITAAVNGLPGLQVIGRQLALLNPRNAVDRETAIALGLIAEEASQVATAQQRHFGEAWGSGLSQRFADGVLKASGLSAWTQAGRWAFGMEFLGLLGRNSDTAFDALDPKIKATFGRYGFDGSHWDAMRTAIEDRSGARFLNPVLVGDDKLGLRLQSMIRSETNFAVPTVTLYGKSAFAGTARPGTISGELVRSFMMYKNFGITLIYTHGRRAAMQTSWRGKLGYGGALIGTSTLLGAAAMQLKEISKGRDPQPMGIDNQKFWMAALAQGGGFGIFGDFLFSDVNRFGGGWAESLAGPVAGAAWDGFSMIGKLKDAAMGNDKANPGGHFERLLERYTPGGSLWYLRLAYQRMILDQIGEMADPNWKDRVNRMQQAAGDKGQDFWWAPGQSPRAPDLANALEPAPN